MSAKVAPLITKRKPLPFGSFGCPASDFFSSSRFLRPRRGPCEAPARALPGVCCREVWVSLVAFRRWCPHRGIPWCRLYPGTLSTLSGGDVPNVWELVGWVPVPARPGTASSIAPGVTAPSLFSSWPDCYTCIASHSLLFFFLCSLAPKPAGL